MTGGYRRMKLFSLMVALIVAGLAVVGGTWATQVDYGSTSSEGESIDTEGEDNKYAVDLQYWNGTNYVTVTDNSLFADSLWCPGRTEVVYMKIVNQEQFPVDVGLTMNVSDLDAGNLSEVLTAAWLLKEKGGLEYADKPTNWGAFYEMAGTNVGELSSGSIPVVAGTHNEYVLAPDSGELTIALAIHMDESATSDYASEGVDLDFILRVNADRKPGSMTEDSNTDPES